MVCFADPSERTNSIIVPTPFFGKEYSTHVEKGSLKGSFSAGALVFPL